MYYRDLLPMSDGIIESITQLPILKKENIRSAVNRIVNYQIQKNKLRYSLTGGTTGEPLKIAKDQRTVVLGSAALLLAKTWAGVRMGDRGVTLKGIGKISLAGRIRQRLINSFAVEAFETGQKQPLQKLDKLKKLKPHYISGYPTELVRLAETNKKAHIRIPVVLSTGEMLYPHQRKALSASFGALVSDYYGSNEINSIAFECEAGRKHVMEEHVILETVDDHGNPVWDKPGRILVTDLDNYAMPLIRYDLGDMGVLTREPCRCGRNLTVLQSLEGRTQDVLRNEGGKILPAIFFAARFRDIQAVRKYQLEQTDWRRIELRYIPLTESADAEIEKICTEIRSRLGNHISIQKEKTNEIPLTARGKSRLVIGLKN
jgi:phenylacetate-CoA ligase